MTLEAQKKFLSKIVKNANDKGCWYLNSDDESRFKSEFYLNRKRFRAKKFSYEHFVGKANPGLKVLCRCHDKLCINPDHHFLGTGSDQIKLIMSRGWKHKKGWKQKPEVVKIISKTHKGKVIPQELRERLSKANLGKKHSFATRKKMSKNRVGIPVKEEARKKIAFSKQGEKNYNTRLTADEVIKIRKAEGRMTIAKTAAKFSISQIHVINIWRKKAWKHLK